MSKRSPFEYIQNNHQSLIHPSIPLVLAMGKLLLAIDHFLNCDLRDIKKRFGSAKYLTPHHSITSTVLLPHKSITVHHPQPSFRRTIIAVAPQTLTTAFNREIKG
jgi:hypothetical protein